MRYATLICMFMILCMLRNAPHQEVYVQLCATAGLPQNDPADHGGWPASRHACHVRLGTKDASAIVVGSSGMPRGVGRRCIDHRECERRVAGTVGDARVAPGKGRRGAQRGGQRTGGSDPSGGAFEGSPGALCKRGGWTGRPKAGAGARAPKLQTTPTPGFGPAVPHISLGRPTTQTPQRQPNAALALAGAPRSTARCWARASAAMWSSPVVRSTGGCTP